MPDDLESAAGPDRPADDVLRGPIVRPTAGDHGGPLGAEHRGLAFEQPRLPVLVIASGEQADERGE